MPVIATGTVVKWTVVDEAGKNARVKYDGCSEPISVYVAGGGGDDSVSSAIISAYIFGQKDPDKDKLLEAASKGLLQVVVINRSPVTPPALP
jgi:hypothetical protein